MDEQVETGDYLVELKGLINKHGRGNESNTPDYILAIFLDDCLRAFDNATTIRTNTTTPRSGSVTL